MLYLIACYDMIVTFLTRINLRFILNCVLQLKNNKNKNRFEYYVRVSISNDVKKYHDGTTGNGNNIVYDGRV